MDNWGQGRANSASDGARATGGWQRGRIVNAVRRHISPRWFFTLAYWRGIKPWDTGVTPPELVRTIEGDGPERLAPGRALDLGCGTGTNAIYLARHGWDVVGIDFASPAIARARGRATRAGSLAGAVRFLRGDVTRLGTLTPGGPFDLVFDLGCLHGLAPEERARYARGVANVTGSGACLLLYAFGPTRIRGRSAGLTEDGVRELFAPEWELERVEHGMDRGDRSSSWYWLRRTG